MSSINCVIRKDNQNYSDILYNLIEDKTEYKNSLTGTFCKSRNSNAYCFKRFNKESVYSFELFTYTRKFDTVLIQSKSEDILKPLALYKQDDNLIYQFNNLFLLIEGTITNKESLIEEFGFINSISLEELILRLYQSYLNMFDTFEDVVNRLHEKFEGNYAFIIFDNNINEIILLKNNKEVYFYFEEFNKLVITTNKLNNFNLYILDSDIYSIVINERMINNLRVFKKKIKDNVKTLCVVNGSIDSYVNTGIAFKKNKNIELLHMNTGKGDWLSLKQSVRCLYNHLFKEDEESNNFIDVRSVINENISLNDSNIYKLLISIISIAKAKEKNISCISLGINKESINNGYSSLNDEMFSKIKNIANMFDISVINYLENLSYKEVIEVGTALEMPLEYVISCDNPIAIDELEYKFGSTHKRFKNIKKLGLSYLPCGGCDKCTYRRYAYMSARIKDPQEDVYIKNKKRISCSDHWAVYIDKNWYFSKEDLNNPTWKKAKLQMLNINF